MDFSDLEKNVYGGNLEDDEELMAELLALEQEEDEKQRRAAPRAPAARPAPARPSTAAVPGIDPSLMAAAMADPTDADVDEQDEDLLRELCELVGDAPRDAPPAPSHQTAPGPPQRVKTAAAPAQPASSKVDKETLHNLTELKVVYERMKADSVKENNSSKTRRLQRSTDKLSELISKVQRGQAVDPADIPPAPPGWTPNAPNSAETATIPTAAVPSPVLPPALPVAPPVGSPIRAAAAAPPTEAPPTRAAPPVPERKASASNPTPQTVPSSSSGAAKDDVKNILTRRRNAYIANGKAANAAQDKKVVMECVQMAKMFDQAIAEIETADVGQLDLSEIPSTPPPYRKKEEVRTFLDGLLSRYKIYEAMLKSAQESNNDRKARMYLRSVTQYKEAIVAARSGQGVNVGELPSLPDMVPLLPQFTGNIAPGTPTSAGFAVVGPSTPSSSQIRSAPAAATASHSHGDTQLQFLVQRQQQFKQAAVMAKNKGNMDLAKKYLVDAKGFDKMIAAARSGLPVSIKDTPIPPQAATPAATLQPRIVATAAPSKTGVENRGEVLSMLEKTLIEQVHLADNNRMRFTRLGDVAKVKLFEGWAKTTKQDLMLVREVAKQGLQLPKFHYENRQIPSADLFPELAEDILELTVVSCKDVPLPSGYEPTHANVFIKYSFPYPTESTQSGKSKYVAGNVSPEFNETFMLQIGGRKARGQKLGRALKRFPLKLEVYQKGGFLRSDKLMGIAEWKLDQLESRAELEESLPLKDGRKAVGGLISVRVRAREPIGDTKMHVTQHKWVILDN